MIRVLHSVSNMDRAGIETMLMNYYRYMDKSKVQFDFLCNKKKPGAYDEEIKISGIFELYVEAFSKASGISNCRGAQWSTWRVRTLCCQNQ